MEAKELRVGNYVNDNLLVCEILCDGVNLTNSDYDQIATYLYDELCPIPLTEEWLIRFGFERNGTQHILESPIYTISLGCDDDEGKVEYTLDIDWWNFSVFIWANETKSIKIEYVHQLQNLYHILTGKELTIQDGISQD